MSCNQKNEVANASSESVSTPLENTIASQVLLEQQLHKDLAFEGNFIQVTQFTDKNGTQLLLFTKTKKTISTEIKYIEREMDQTIYVYHYVLNAADTNYELNWKIQDFEKHCDFDLIIKFLVTTPLITDLNDNGIAEIWTGYQKAVSLILVR